MPDFTFTFTVLGITTQRATAIRDKLNQRLTDDGVAIASIGYTRNTVAYRVIGVDTADRTVFDETVEANDPDAAKDMVIGTSTTRVVAIVRPADQR